MKNVAKKLLKEFEDQNIDGFFLDFFAQKTGFEFGSDEYSEVQELLMEDRI